MPDDDYTEYVPPAAEPEPKSEQEKPGIGEPGWQPERFLEDLGRRLSDELGDDVRYLQFELYVDGISSTWMTVTGLIDEQGELVSAPEGWDLSYDDMKGIVTAADLISPPLWPPDHMPMKGPKRPAKTFEPYIDLYEPYAGWDEQY